MPARPIRVAGRNTDDDEHITRFRAEYPIAFEALKQRLENAACRGRYVDFSVDAGDLTSHDVPATEEEFQYFRKGQSYAYVSDHGNNWPKDRVVCYRPNALAFVLRRWLVGPVDPGAPKGPWVVVEHKAGPDIDEPPRPVPVPVTLFGAIVPDWNWSDSKLRILGATEIPAADENLFELHFEFRIMPGTVNEIRTVFSPALHWAVCRSEETVRSEKQKEMNGWFIQTNVDYGERHAGNTFPRTITKVTQWYRNDSIFRSDDQRVEFTEVSFGTVTDDQFTPGAFNALESPPSSPQPELRSEYVPLSSKFDDWLGCVIVGTVVFGVLFSIGYRRYRRSHQPPLAE